MATWEATARKKRESILNLIPSEWRISNPPSREEQRDVTGSFTHQYLTNEEIEITETDAINIVEKTSTGQWSAVAVTKAFCHRAALAHQLTNCLLEIFFDQGLAHARELDEYFAKNKKPIGPLHGLPVSLKDQMHVKGVETSMGYVGWIETFQGKKGTGKEKVFESELTRELLGAGAVLYCKTSVPHTLMSGQTENHIVGYCWNPKNRLLSSGGSSGGEGALIAFRGSPLGWGSDIGGSIRLPAAFCGIYGIRPSAGRIPYEGAGNSMDGQNTVLSVLGPLGTSVGSLKLAMKAILAQEPWLYDPLCLEIPWRTDEERQMMERISGGEKLSFAQTISNGDIQPHPPVQRAMNMVIKAMKDLGHDMIEWNPKPRHVDLAGIAFQTWLFDGGQDVHNALGLSGEPPIATVEAGYGRKAQPEKGATYIAEVNVAKREAQKAYMDYWNSTASSTSTGRPVDCIICPTNPCAAFHPQKYTYYPFTMWVNTLDYTSVIIPVTRVDQDIDTKPTTFTPLTDEDAKVAEGYDAEEYHGTPVSIQLVGRRLQEEKMLVIADYVSKALAASKGS